MTFVEQVVVRVRLRPHQVARDASLAVVDGLAEVVDGLRAEWDDPVLTAKLQVLDDETLDDERRARVVAEIPRQQTWTRNLASR